MPKGALMDTNVFAIGVGVKNRETGEYYNLVVIPANAPYDGKRYELKTTTYADDQETIAYTVFEGESPVPAECTKLGEFEVRGLPKKPRGEVKVVVKLGFDRDGVISGYALHEETGIRKDVAVARDGRGAAVPLRE
jgi:molecular chaperone DnaK